MKIVVTGTRGIPNIMGGVETHCEELFPRIARKGFEVTVIRRKSYVRDTLSSYKGITLSDIETPRKKSLEAIVHTFRAIVRAKRLKANIVHIHAVGPALLTPLARLLGMKVVFTHHGPDYDRDKWGMAAKTALRLGEAAGTLFANEVIVISHVIDDMLIRKYGRKDCHVIYNGVPSPDVTDYPEYFGELGIEQGKYIFAMCRFVPEKNLHHLIEAFSRTEHRECKLVIAGDSDFEDDYSASLKKYAREQGVVLPGFIKGRKLHALLSHARCFVLPSSHEGLPIALLEAMSYRLPVIVSDIPRKPGSRARAGILFPVGRQKGSGTQTPGKYGRPLPANRVSHGKIRLECDRRTDGLGLHQIRETGEIATALFPAADFRHDRPDESYELRRGDFQLEAADAGADVDGRKRRGRGVDIGRKLFFHADRRAAATDVTRHGQQLLHRNQVGLLVARYACGGLEVDLVVGGHHAYEMPRAVAPQHEGLEYASYIFAQLFGHVRRCEVFFINPVRDEFIGYLSAVEQAGRIGLFDFSVCHFCFWCSIFRLKLCKSNLF